jgi:copper chaperone CopZ
MFRTALVLAALSFAPAALACGGNKDCAHCNAPSEVVVDDVEAADGTKVSFAITGMSCGRCSDKIVAALKAVDGVNAVKVDHEAGSAKVAFDDGKADVDKLLAAIGALGKYEATVKPAES